MIRVRSDSASSKPLINYCVNALRPLEQLQDDRDLADPTDGKGKRPYPWNRHRVGNKVYDARPEIHFGRHHSDFAAYPGGICD